MLLPQRALFVAIAIGLGWPSWAESPAEQEVGWNNLASLFAARWAALAPERHDLELAALSHDLRQGLRFDPKLDISHRRGLEPIASQEQNLTLSQSTPWGTTLSASTATSRSKAAPSSATDPAATANSESRSQSLSVAQELLRGGPWHGLAQDRAAQLQREQAELAAEDAQAEALLAAYKALAEAEESQGRLAASQAAHARAEQQHRAVSELVRSGYRAKADLLVSEAALIRARDQQQKSEAQALASLRRLGSALFFEPKTKLLLSKAEPDQTWIEQLRSVPAARETTAEALARLNYLAQQAEAERAARDELPSLNLKYSLSRTETEPTGAAAASGRNWQRSVELGFSAPLVSAIRRPAASSARLAASKAEALWLKAKNARAEQLEDARRLNELARLAWASARSLADLAMRSLSIEQQKYADGKASIADVRRVQDEVDQAQLAAIAARREWLVTSLTWARLCGQLPRLSAKAVPGS